MNAVRMYEQADKGIHYFIYSWILDGISGNKKSDMAQLGWKWIRGKPTGSYVTSSKEAAVRLAAMCNVVIQSNGTHDVINAPGMLISMPQFVEGGVK
jgi:hypothetical protein